MRRRMPTVALIVLLSVLSAAAAPALAGEKI